MDLQSLLLQVLVAGSHGHWGGRRVSIGGLAVLFPVIQNGPVVTPGALRGAAAGTLLGLGFAAKPTAALMAIGLAIALVAARKRLAAVCLRRRGSASVAVTDLLVMVRGGSGRQPGRAPWCRWDRRGGWSARC